MRNTLGIFIFQTHPGGLMRPHRKEHRLETIVKETVNIALPLDLMVESNLDPPVQYLINVPTDRIYRQSIRRHSQPHHTAGHTVFFKYRNSKARLTKF